MNKPLGRSRGFITTRKCGDRSVAPTRLTVAGLFALANLFIFGMRAIAGFLQIRGSSTADTLIYFPAVIGAALGGVALVWLKMRIFGRGDAALGVCHDL